MKKLGLFEVVKILFTKQGYQDLSTEVKAANFFMINRLLSKKWPTRALALNSKIIEPDIALDIWYQTIPEQPVPYWFWKRPEILTKDKSDLDQTDTWIIENYFPKLIEEAKQREEVEKLGAKATQKINKRSKLNKFKDLSSFLT